MPIFTAIAAAVTTAATAIGFSTAVAAAAGAVAAFATRTLLTIGITKLLVNRSGKTAAGATNAGARVQLPPATDNKLPVVYGSAFVGGIITDAKISTDQKTMWYVLTLAEHTDTTAGSGYTFNDIYYDGKLVTFGTGGDAAKVVSLTTNESTPVVDTKINGFLYIYQFTNGSSSGVNTGGQTAIQILQDSDIPSAQRWTSTDVMSNAAFLIVKVIYNQDAGTTNLGAVKVQLENSLYEPGSVIKDYLLNERYGCGVPLARIDTVSLTDLDTYSAQTITYTPVGGGSATQERYRIDGPINTGNDCLSNLQQLVDACDSWLQYSELSGKWKVVINKAYDQSPNSQTLNDLFEVNSDILIGGIEVNPLDLNNMYNEVEIQYPNYNITDQTDYVFVSLWDEDPSLLSPNEPLNKLTIQLPIVNNYIQAKYIGLRRLYQGREDLVISFATDYSGIQVEAGDVIKVTLSQYGWTDKLFRVTYVGEQKYPDGSLGATMTAYEYNSTVYTDNPLQDFVPEANTGLSDPNIIGTPAAPTFTLDTSNTVNTLNVYGIVPNTGLVRYMDFNYGTSNNSATHLYYTTAYNSNGAPLLANTNVSITMTNLPTANYFWSVSAKNDTVSVRSNSSANSVTWPGANVTVWNGNTGGITNNNVANYTITSNKLSNTGVVAGSYTSANITVGIDGRITAAANGTSGINVQDEGNLIVNTATVNFVGNGVSVSNVASVATITITGASANAGYPSYNYINDGSFFQTGNTFTAINSLIAYGASRIPANNQANTSTGNFESLTFDSYYPWYTNNSLTTNGYNANSTSSLTPSNAALQDIGSTPAAMGGRAGWWTIIGSIVDSSNLVANQQVQSFTQAQVVTDANLTIQVGGWYQTTQISNGLNQSNAIKPDTTITNYTFTANIPQIVQMNFSIDGNSTYAVSEMGMCLRAIGSGNAYIIWGQSLLQIPSGAATLSGPWDYNSVGWIL